MTPKEKAEQLVESFMNIKQQKLADYSIIYHPTAKQCAIIAVDEILETTKLPNYLISNAYDTGTGSGMRKLTGYNYSSYWKEVKQEIENL